MKRFLLACALLSFVVGGSTPALAQGFGQGFGEIYFTTDLSVRNSLVELNPFQTLNFYLAIEMTFADIGMPGQDLSNGFSGWEAKCTVPPELIITSRTKQPPSSINVGNDAQDNWIVGTGMTITAATTPYGVVHYSSLLLSAAEDLVLSIGPAEPSSFAQPGGPGPMPGWLEGVATGECVNKCLRPFETFDSRLVINCVNETECNPVVNEGIEIAVGSGSVDVGTVDVPVSVRRIELPKLDGDPSLLAGLDLTIAWDPTLATLADVLLTPATAGWLMEFNAGAGTVDISMASLDVIDVPVLPLDVLELRFDAPGVEGQTPLMILASQAFDVDQDPIPHTTSDGDLVTGCEKGDVIPDGEVNSADGIRALLIAMDLLTPTDAEFCAADMNSDGIVDPGDVVLLLQKAVGIVPTGVLADQEPVVYLRSGDALGDVIVHVENVAALEMKLAFDADQATFVSASAPGSKGLTAANDGNPGVVNVGFARATNYTGDLLLRFDVQQSHTTLDVSGVWAYDELGRQHPVTLLSDEFIFGVTSSGDAPVDRTRMLGAVPNPFNPRTDLRFRLATAGDAQLRVFDSAGRLVREFALRGLDAGTHSVTWDGQDDAGARVASGAYFVQLRSGQHTDTSRVVLVK